jgi:hypothetical protein
LSKINLELYGKELNFIWKSFFALWKIVNLFLFQFNILFFY